MSTLKAEQHTFYRERITTKDLISFPLVIKETDLLVFADSPLKEKAEESVLYYRSQIEEYIRRFPDFFHSLTPLP